MWSQNWGEMIWGVGTAVPGLSPISLLLVGVLLIGVATIFLHRRQSALTAGLFAVFVVIPLSAWAGSVALPNTFTNGTVADADEVNANFQALAVAVNDNDGRIGDLSVFGTNTSDAASGSGDLCTLGEVWLTAGAIASGVPALGQILQINQNSAMFSLLGTLYGGDGETTFALPDLRDVAPNGLTYVICMIGQFPARR